MNPSDFCLLVFQIIHPRRSEFPANRSVLTGDDVYGSFSTYRVHTRFRGPLTDGSGVPPIFSSPPFFPQANVSNVKFRQSIHMIAQLVASQAERGATFTLSLKTQGLANL